MVTQSDELQAVCSLHGVNHLIYAGFAVNYCLLMSPGGMLDMSRRGFLCSVVKEATTAVECGFSAREEWAKQLALWNVALSFGFVYEQNDLENALSCRGGTFVGLSCTKVVPPAEPLIKP